MSVGMRDRRGANVGCCESRGGSPFSSGVRLNNSRGIELGGRIAPGKMMCEVAGVVIPPLPVLLFAVVVLQLNWRLALPSVLILLTESPLGQRRIRCSQELFVEDVCRRRTIDTEREILACRGSC
jgi:hypothetical protein